MHGAGMTYTIYQRARYSGTMEVIPYNAQGNFHYHNLASFNEVLYRFTIARRPVFGDAVLQVMWQLMLKVARLHAPAGVPEGPDAPSAPEGPPEGPDAPSAPARAPEGPDAPSAPASVPKGPDLPSAPARAPEGPDAPSAPAGAPEGLLPPGDRDVPASPHAGGPSSAPVGTPNHTPAEAPPGTLEVASKGLRAGGPSGAAEGPPGPRYAEAPSGPLETPPARPPSASSASLQAQPPVGPADAAPGAAPAGTRGDTAAPGPWDRGDAQGKLDEPQPRAALANERLLEERTHEDV